MLRALLAEHTRRPAGSFELSAGEHGKPVCVDGPAVSISHSGDTVACAIMDTGDIGIDIEFPGRSRDVTGIAERYFSRGEVRWLAGRPPEHFYWLWVLKESWLKATGAGISGGLDKLRCTVTPPRIETEPGSVTASALRLYALRDGLLGIAAIGAQPDVTLLHRWQPSKNAFVAADDVELIASSDAAR
jgi:4'-phosphopantetheinyl transferase